MRVPTPSPACRFRRRMALKRSPIGTPPSAWASRVAIRSPAASTRRCTPGALGPCGSTPASARRPSPTRATTQLARGRHDGAVGRVRPADPDGVRLRRTRSPTARSARSAWRSTRIDDMRLLFHDIPLDKVSTSMTINAPAACCCCSTSSSRRSTGSTRPALTGTIQNDILKEYIARGTYIFPPKPSLRLVADTFAYCRDRAAEVEHDLDLRLPHGRGRRDARAGDRVHARQRRRVRPGRDRRGAGRRRVRAAAVVLLRRPDDPAGGGGQVPGRPPDLGPDHARRVRGQGAASRGCCASTPRPRACS